MATPAIPSSFSISQSAAPGAIRVLTAWSQVAGATSYSVQRSSDGINYAEVGPATTNRFLDTTVSPGALYYYKVASTNVSGTSPYTSALQVVPTMQGNISLFEILLRGRQMADAVGDTNVLDTELKFQANRGYYEVYNKLIESTQDFFVEMPRLILTLAQSNNPDKLFYDLPDGMNYGGVPAWYKMYGVDYGYSTAAYSWIAMKKFPFLERNEFAFSMAPGLALNTNIKYHILGNKMMLNTVNVYPDLGIWYYPRLTELLLPEDTMDQFAGYDDYVIARVAKYILDKQESPSDHLAAEMAGHMARIEMMSKDRDVGQPDVVPNCKRMNGYFGMMR